MRLRPKLSPGFLLVNSSGIFFRDWSAEPNVRICDGDGHDAADVKLGQVDNLSPEKHVSTLQLFSERVSKRGIRVGKKFRIRVAEFSPPNDCFHVLARLHVWNFEFEELWAHCLGNNIAMTHSKILLWCVRIFLSLHLQKLALIKEYFTTACR